MNIIKFLLIALVAMTSAQAEDQQSPFSANVSVGFYSDYMWRGFNLYDGSSIQPSTRLAYQLGDFGTVSYSAWAHLSAEDATNTDRFTEVDHTAALDVPFNWGTVSVGHLWYTYPADSDNIADSAEYYAAVAFTCPLNPVVSFYNDYDQYKSEYFELNLSHSFAIPELGDGFAVRPTASFGFADSASRVYQHNGLEQATVGVAFDLQLGDVAVTPSLNYTFTNDDNLDNQFWMGTSFSYNF